MTILIRKARITDIETIHKFITHYSDLGLMLPRSRSSLYEGVREFTVAEDSGEIIGAGSLHIIWEDLAEIRSLVVHPDHQRKGVGKVLVQSFLSETDELEIPRVFALTYQDHFFQKCGFKIIDKDDLPQKVWKECINCPKFPKCEEVAVIKYLK